MTKTPNNFFAEDKYGSPSGRIDDVKSFDDMRVRRVEELRKPIDARASEMVGRQRGLLAGEQPKTPEQRKGKVRKAAATALLAATATVLAPHVPEAVHSAVETVTQDEMFNPGRDNGPAPQQTKEQVDHQAEMKSMEDQAQGK